MKISDRPVDKVRVGARPRKKEEKRARTRGRDGNGSHREVRARSVRIKGTRTSRECRRHPISSQRRQPPRISSSDPRSWSVRPNAPEHAPLYYASARLDLFSPSRSEIILEIPSRICRYFVTRLAHVDANDLMPPVPELPDAERIFNRPESVNLVLSTNRSYGGFRNYARYFEIIKWQNDHT